MPLLRLIILALLAQFCSGAADAADALIEEFDDRIVVQVTGSSAQTANTEVYSSLSDDSLKQKQFDSLRLEAANLRRAAPGETEEQARERKIKVSELLLKIRQMQQEMEKQKQTQQSQ